MVNPKSRRWILWTIGVFALLAVGVLIAIQLAVRSLKQDVLHVFGSQSRISDLHLGIMSVVISGIRVNAPTGWPTASTLRAERVVIIPDLRQSLLRHPYITSIRVDNGYISAVRPKQGGGLQILPSIFGNPKKRQAESTGRTADIQAVELNKCVVDIFDSTISGHQRLHVEAVQGSLKDVQAPTLEGPIKVNLKGIIRGPVHEGTITVDGWVDVAKKSSKLTIRARNVDLALFEPYLMRKLKSEIGQGTFNLDIKSTVHDNLVEAPGTLVLTDFKFNKGSGIFGDLTNIPRRAVIAAMADSQHQVVLKFELKGDLDSPAFSLSEGFSLRMATALLKGFGLGFEGLIRAFFALVAGFGSTFIPSA